MKIKVLTTLESILQHSITVLESWREHCAVCPHCGENRYTGPSCILVGPTDEPMGHREII